MSSMLDYHTPHLSLPARGHEHHISYPLINSGTLPQATQAPWRGWQHSWAAVDSAYKAVHSLTEAVMTPITGLSTPVSCYQQRMHHGW